MVSTNFDCACAPSIISVNTESVSPNPALALNMAPPIEFKSLIQYEDVGKTVFDILLLGQSLI